MNCRHCGESLEHVFCDLNTCPPSNAMVKKEQLVLPESHFPLKVFVCPNCWLVQTEDIAKATDIFTSEYTYFSSYSTSWLKHAEEYVDYMMKRFSFDQNSLVVEIASNDGYLLQYFKQKGIPVLGIEPTANTAAVAREKGIDSRVEFFTGNLARSMAGTADLVLGNNVLAHVPDVNDFMKGVKIALKENGIATFEFPHLCQLKEHNQFDTIYHEHFSYFSLLSLKSIAEMQELQIFDVQELKTHGGSLRVFLKHKDDKSRNVEPAVNDLLEEEKSLKVNHLSYYSSFQEKVNLIKYDFIDFLIQQKKAGKKVIGYGAAAKGNTLLNYCGIKGADLLSFVVDASPHKQGKFLPGSRIPVYGEIRIKNEKPDFIVIFPWNIRKEITEQLAYVKEWGCKFAVAVPQLTILN